MRFCASQSKWECKEPPSRRGGKHPRLRGVVAGRSFDMPFSETKVDAYRCLQATKCNIRREVRRLREVVAT